MSAEIALLRRLLGVGASAAIHRQDLAGDVMETQCGRTRDAPKWVPRAMDLDILLFGDVVQDTPGLVLPRPNLLCWPFMLGPLAEVAPDLLHPLRRLPIAQLWREFPAAGHSLQSIAIDLNAS